MTLTTLRNDVDDRGRNVLAGQPVAFLVAARAWGHCIMMHPPGGFCQHQFAAGYQDEARGADAAITDAIWAHVESEQGEGDDDGGARPDQLGEPYEIVAISSPAGGITALSHMPAGLPST